jgi:hypothetical protein
VEQVRTGTGDLVDSQDQVGGWPNLEGAPWVDADGDYLPDAWESAHDLDPARESDTWEIVKGVPNLLRWLAGEGD